MADNNTRQTGNPGTQGVELSHINFAAFMETFWLWLRAETEAENGAVRQQIETLSIVWDNYWRLGKRVQIGGIIVFLFSILFAAVLCFIMKTGMPFAVAGMFAALAALPIAIFWQPIIFIAFVTRHYLKTGNLITREAIQSGIQGIPSSWHFFALFIMWVMIVCLYGAIVPWYNRIEMVPLALLVVLLFVLTGIVWQRRRWYRKVIFTTMVLTLVVCVLAVSMPATSKAISEKTGKLDSQLAKNIEQGTVNIFHLFGWGSQTSANDKMPVQTKPSNFSIRDIPVLPTGKHEISLGKGEVSEWIKIPSNSNFDLYSPTNDSWELHFYDGRRFSYNIDEKKSYDFEEKQVQVFRMIPTQVASGGKKLFIISVWPKNG